MKKYLFLDTEFAKFNCDVSGLLSVGVVAEDGHYWYGVNKHYAKSDCSDFVINEVLPLLMMPPPVYTGTLVIMARRLSDWIEEQKSPVTMVIDYIGDWLLLLDLFEQADCWPANLDSQPESWQELIRMGTVMSREVIQKKTAEYLDAEGWKAHNALADACANWHIWKLAMASVTPTLEE